MEGIIQEFSSKVGMDAFLDKEPTLLSGGQKQRVAIAGVLAMRPDIVVLDEATSMLDPKGRNEIKELTVKMRELYPSLTILSITHDVEEALQADEVIILNQGELFYHGEAKEIFLEEQKLVDIHLDIPFLYKLKKELQAVGVNLEAKTKEAMVKELCQ